jgi:hypothetical protein
MDRPERLKEFRSPITCRAKINGLWATILLDSGSEVDMVSPDFLDNCVNPEVYRLKKPLSLGMAVAGSAAQVNYGVYLDISIGDSFSARHYADVQKCQKVDLILGIPFMSKYNVSTTFGESREFCIGPYKFSARLESKRETGKTKETVSFHKRATHSRSRPNSRSPQRSQSKGYQTMDRRSNRPPQ